ncbi:MAG: GlsB/YeaQ/YmgE family stress response membrane protein [Cyanobacteria bacterium J06598_3]
MGILAWAVLGLIAGAIARAIYPGEQSLGIIGTMVLGIIGALVGGFLYSLIGGASGVGLTFGGVVVAVLGAILTLFIYYAVTKRTA